MVHVIKSVSFCLEIENPQFNFARQQAAALQLADSYEPIRINEILHAFWQPNFILCDAQQLF